MLEDSAQELTSNVGAGQAFTATGFSGNAYDLGSAGVDPAIGGLIQPLWQVMQNFDNLTSAVVDFGHADDAAGSGFVSLSSSGSVTLANLTTANSPMKRLPAVGPGLITKRYLLYKFTITGTAPSVGKIRGVFQKGGHTVPVNPGAL